MRTARVILMVMLLGFLAVGATCQQPGVNVPMDAAIQYRSAFNTMLMQWNSELAVMPPADQKVWAQKALPFVKSGVLALDSMDIAVGLGGQPSPETVRAYLAANNQMIDLLAQLILAKKGAK